MPQPNKILTDEEFLKLPIEDQAKLAAGDGEAEGQGKQELKSGGVEFKNVTINPRPNTLSSWISDFVNGEQGKNAQEDHNEVLYLGAGPTAISAAIPAAAAAVSNATPIATQLGDGAVATDTNIAPAINRALLKKIGKYAVGAGSVLGMGAIGRKIVGGE